MTAKKIKKIVIESEPFDVDGYDNPDEDWDNLDDDCLDFDWEDNDEDDADLFGSYLSEIETRGYVRAVRIG